MKIFIKSMKIFIKKYESDSEFIRKYEKYPYGKYGKIFKIAPGHLLDGHLADGTFDRQYIF